ncbi:hypothetical protein PM082_004537 [Marasmius tenuissimus]|nr:hypothetical protein PM082_004537 [Marasmius tenuissimus]
MWTIVDQTLIEFNVIKTNNYISLFKTLLDRTQSTAWAARLYMLSSGLMFFCNSIISCIFDYLMICRCYVIWGYSKRILYPFALVAIVTDVTAFVLMAIETAAYQHQNNYLYLRTYNIINVLVIISAIYVSLLTLLTAGRIWWTVRQVGQITGSRVYAKYKIFVATILESGFLFSATAVVGVVLSLILDPNSTGLTPFDFGVISVQMSGIAQTVIIVRIAYGQAVESIQQMVSTLQFTQGSNHPQQQSTAACGPLDLQQSLAVVEERGTVGRIEMSDKPPSNVAGDIV